MTKENFHLAIEIILENHSSELIINHVKPNGQVSTVIENPTISIKNCCARVIGNLLAHGFSLSMNEGLLSVDKF